MSNTPEIHRLLPRHFKILEMRLAGCSNKEIAESVNCTPQNIHIVCRSPLFIAEFNRKLQDQIDYGISLDREAFVGKAQSMLNVASLQAAETQVDLMESDDDSVRLRASGSILDRALGKVESKTSDSAASQVVINTSDATLLIIALKESNNAQVSHPTANGSVSQSSSDQPRDVHQTPRCRPWFGHRTPEAQAPETALVVVGGVE